MNLFIDSTYKLSNETILKLFNNMCLDTNIIQINVSNYDEVIRYITDTRDHENIQFMNKINSFLDIKNVNLLTNDKILLYKLCLLYCCGGIFINSNMFIPDFFSVKNVHLNNDNCFVKSSLNESMFPGLLCCKKRNKILYGILKQLIDISNDKSLSDLLIRNENVLLLTEKIQSDKSDIYYYNEIIAEHYFKNTLLLERYKIIKSIPTDLSKIKIGITISIPETLNAFYSNGIRQNCLYLYELLKNMDYDVKLIIDNAENASVLTQIDFFNFEYILQNDIFTYDFHLIFSMGFSFPSQILHSLKNMGIKIIYYMCGNNYLIDCEKILYNQHNTRNINYSDELYYDQIWIIPQMYNQNKYYYEILTKTKCIQIPFIWSSMSIKLTAKILKVENENDFLYSKKNAKIAIFEPNISVMKWCFPCVLIAENTYRNYKNIEHIYITNLCKTNNDTNHFNMEQFNNICRNLDLFKDKKLSSEFRYNTLEFMRNYCDIAISHQWENPLNYLYLDLAWMGWPILHNAYLCKDIGYYYEGFNYIEASEKLNHIIINHSKNINEYIKKNRKIIDEYLPTNKDLQNKYKNLINNLF